MSQHYRRARRLATAAQLLSSAAHIPKILCAFFGVCCGAVYPTIAIIFVAAGLPETPPPPGEDDSRPLDQPGSIGDVILGGLQGISQEEYDRVQQELELEQQANLALRQDLLDRRREEERLTTLLGIERDRVDAASDDASRETERANLAEGTATVLRGERDRLSDALKVAEEEIARLRQLGGCTHDDTFRPPRTLDSLVGTCVVERRLPPGFRIEPETTIYRELRFYGHRPIRGGTSTTLLAVVPGMEAEQNIAYRWFFDDCPGGEVIGTNTGPTVEFRHETAGQCDILLQFGSRETSLTYSVP